MPDFSQTRSQYLKIMLGERKDALAPYRPEQMNDLGDTSFDVASLSDDDINNAISQMTGTKYEGTDVFKSLQTEQETRKQKADGESGEKPWWQQVGDFFQNLGSSIFEGILTVVDEVKDFGLGVAGGLGGGFFGQENDFTDWVANAMTDDSWIRSTVDFVDKFTPNYFQMLTHIGDDKYWNNYWTWNGDEIAQKWDRRYQGQEGVRKVGNFVGEIIPHVALAVATGGSSLAASAAAQAGFGFATGMGRGQSQALSQGASFQESAGYGAAEGGITAALAAISTVAGGTLAKEGGSGFVKKVGQSFGNFIGNSMKSETARVIADKSAQIIIRAAGSAGTAAVRTAVEPAVQLIYDDNAWYNAYGTEENRQKYFDVIKTSALTAAAGSAIVNTGREFFSVIRAGGFEQYKENYFIDLQQSAVLKSMTRSERRDFIKSQREYLDYQKEVSDIQKQVDAMRATGKTDSEIQDFAVSKMRILAPKIDAWSDKYQDFYSKLSYQYSASLDKAKSSMSDAQLSSAAMRGANRFAGMLSDIRTGSSLKSGLIRLGSSIASRGGDFEFTQNEDGSGQAKVGTALIAYKGDSDSVFYTSAKEESLPPVEAKVVENKAALVPTNAEQMQTIAKLAGDPAAWHSMPKNLILPLRTGNANIDITDLTPRQVAKLATLGQNDFAKHMRNRMIADLGDGKSLVIANKGKTAEIIDTPEQKPIEALHLKAEESVVKMAANSKPGLVYDYTKGKKMDLDITGFAKSFLEKNGRGGEKSIEVLNAPVKALVDNLNIGTKEQQEAALTEMRDYILGKKVRYEESETLTIREILELLGEDKQQEFNDKITEFYNELLASGRDSAVTKMGAEFEHKQQALTAKYEKQVARIEAYVDKLQESLAKWIAAYRETVRKKNYAVMLARNRSKIRERVTGDYDYGKIEERNLHTINMHAKALDSLVRNKGVFKAEAKTLDAFSTALKYYIPENYEDANSPYFSEELATALGNAAGFIREEVGNRELSADALKALWDYENAILKYEKELKQIDINDRKPRIYAASRELQTYNVSKVQKVADFIVNNFGGTAGEIVLKFGYGEVAKAYVIEPIKAMGKAKDFVSKGYEAIKAFLPKKGFHSKKKVGELNGVKVTRGQLIFAYISTILADDNAIDADLKGIGIPQKNGSVKRVYDGNIKTIRDGILALISDEDKAYAKAFFDMFNEGGYLRDSYVSFEKDYRHKIDVKTVKNYAPKFKYKNYKANVDNPVGNMPLFPNEIDRTGDRDMLVIRDVMDVVGDYLTKLGEMKFMLPVNKRARAIRNGKTENGELFATEAINKFGKETMDLLDNTIDEWLVKGKKEIRTVVNKVLDVFMHGYGISKLANPGLNPLKNYLSYVTSNVGLKNILRAIPSRADKRAMQDVSWLIENEIYELKYRFSSNEMSASNAPTIKSGFVEKMDNALLIGVRGIDFAAMLKGLHAIVLEARRRGYDVRSEEGRDLVHSIYAIFYVSNVGSTPLHMSKMSRSNLRYVFDILAGAKRAQVASFAIQGSLFHQFKGMTKEQIDKRLSDAKALAKEAEKKTKEASDNYEKSVEALEAARQKRDELVNSKADKEAIEAAKEKVKQAKEAVKAKKEAQEQAEENEARANAGQREAENQKEGFAQYDFAGGKTIPVSILIKTIIAGSFITLVSIVTKWLYGKKNFNEYKPEEIVADISLNSFVNWVPVIDSISQAFIYKYEIDAPSVTMINEVINTFSNIFQSIQDGKFTGATINSLIAVLEGITGLPLSIVKKYVYGILSKFNPALAYKFNDVFYNGSPTKLASTAKEYAEKNDISTAADLYQYLYAGYKTGEVSREVIVEQSKLVKEGFNPIARSVPEYITDENGVQTILTDDQRSDFYKEYSKVNQAVESLIKHVKYKAMDSSAKAKAIKKVYDLYYEAARYRVLGVEPDSKLGRLLAYASDYDADVIATLLLIQRNSQLADTKRQTKKEQAVKLVNQQSMSRNQKLLTLYLMGYGVNEKNKKSVQNYLISLGFTKKQAEEFLPLNK